MFSFLKRYFIESYGELQQVSWPSKDKTLLYTGIVITVSLICAALLGGLDYFFGQLLQELL